MFVLFLLDCSVVLFVALVFASVVVFVSGFCASACFFLLHEPSGCVLLAFYQKQHGRVFLLLLASFLEHLK